MQVLLSSDKQVLYLFIYAIRSFYFVSNRIRPCSHVNAYILLIYDCGYKIEYVYVVVVCRISMAVY